MKQEHLKIWQPLVLIGWCPQCKKVLKEYDANVSTQTLFEDDIIHRSESIDMMNHTPFLMVIVVA